MKKIITLTAIAITFFSSCKMSQLASNTDDVYLNPAEEKKAAQLAAAEKAKSDALEKQKVLDAQAAQKAKDDANPYYKDPQYSQDDYYDYQYASRVNRFQTPVAGASYYDPYYTNLYTYNQNPANYGTSIYSTYNYGMPSNQFSNYSMGISTGYGGYNNCFSCMSSNYGYNNYGGSSGMGYGYNNYGFNNYNYYNDPFYNSYGYGGMGSYGGYNNYGYNGFNTGYNAGYYNGYNNAQWGYYNSYDPNSAYGQVQNSPRGGTSGGSGMVTTSSGGRQGSEDGRVTYFQSVANQQSTTPRFTSVAGRSDGRNTGSNGYTPSNNSSSGYQNNDRFINQRNQSQPDNNLNNSNSRQSDRNTNNERSQENNSYQNRSNNSGWNNSNSGGGGGNYGGGGRSGGGGGSNRPR